MCLVAGLTALPRRPSRVKGEERGVGCGKGEGEGGREEGSRRGKKERGGPTKVWSALTPMFVLGTEYIVPGCNYPRVCPDPVSSSK